LGVFDVNPGGRLVLRELNSGVTMDEIRAKTGCGFDVKIVPSS
jgi:3-oxoacid CoA-transferase